MRPPHSRQAVFSQEKVVASLNQAVGNFPLYGHQTGIVPVGFIIDPVGFVVAELFVGPKLGAQGAKQRRPDWLGGRVQKANLPRARTSTFRDGREGCWIE